MFAYKAQALQLEIFYIVGVFFSTSLRFNAKHGKKTHNKTRMMYCSMRQIQKSLLAQRSLKQIFGGFIERSSVVFFYFYLVLVFFCLFVEHVLLRACVRKMST